MGGHSPGDLKPGAGAERFPPVAHCLAVGGVIGIFPEAAYGPREGELQATFKSGFAHFAVKNRVPVLPVALSGTRDLWLRKRIEVVIGKPIAPGDDFDRLLAASRSALQALLPEYHEPPGRKPLRSFLTRLLY